MVTVITADVSNPQSAVSKARGVPVRFLFQQRDFLETESRVSRGYSTSESEGEGDCENRVRHVSSINETFNYTLYR